MSGRLPWIALGVLATIVVGTRLLPLTEWLRQGFALIGRWGPWGSTAFVGLYVVATILLLPASVLTLGAGAAFGVIQGTALVSLASTLGAMAAFLIGRHCFRAAVTQRVHRNPRFAALDAAVTASGWRIVLLTRLSPIFPFTFLNYAFGLTRIGLGPYLLASWLGMLPGTLLYVYLGSIARAASEPRARSTAEWWLYGIGLSATVTVALLVTRIARQALGKQLESRPVAAVPSPPPESHS